VDLYDTRAQYSRQADAEYSYLRATPDQLPAIYTNQRGENPSALWYQPIHTDRNAATIQSS
jgi:hypothetical protein